MGTLPNTGSTCLQCGKPLSALAGLWGHRNFCSHRHRLVYHQEASELDALALLRLTDARERKSEPDRALEVHLRPDTMRVRPRAPGLARVRVSSQVAMPVLRFGLRAAFFKPALPDLGWKQETGLGVDCGLVPVAHPRWRRPQAPAPQGNPCPAEFVSGAALPPASVSWKAFQPASAACLDDAAAGQELASGAESAPPRGRMSQAPVEPKIRLVHPVGFSDSEVPIALKRRPAIKPAVVGADLAPIALDLTEAVAEHVLRMRGASRLQGLFIPGMLMGTLRPRVAFGPPSQGRPQAVSIAQQRPPRRLPAVAPAAGQAVGQ